jgi:hypothetical protein
VTIRLGCLACLLWAVAPSPAGRADLALSGRVRTPGPNGTAIRRAAIELREADGPVRIALADDDGRFVFDHLLADAYQITASKVNYVTATYGEPTPGTGRGLDLRVDAAHPAPSVTLTMARAGVVSGFVHDALGRPVRGWQMTAFFAPAGSGPLATQALQAAATYNAGTPVSTDDRGEYRLWGLPAGRFLVAAARSAADPRWYYPDASTPRMAVPITLGIQEDRAGVDFIVERTAPAPTTAWFSRPTGSRRPGPRDVRTWN